jgi:hypothetical protein
MAETAPNGAIWLVPLAKLLAALALHALICLPLKKLGFSASARIKTARDQRRVINGAFKGPEKANPPRRRTSWRGLLHPNLAVLDAAILRENLIRHKPPCGATVDFCPQRSPTFWRVSNGDPCSKTIHALNRSQTPQGSGHHSVAKVHLELLIQPVSSSSLLAK